MGNIHIRMRKRRKSKESEAVAIISNVEHHQPSSSIFNLIGHCIDELLEYLSLKDLHSLGQTCRTMQCVTGKFFTRNYSAAKIVCESDGIYVIHLSHCNRIIERIPIPGFIQFITSVAIEGDLGPFKFIKLHANEFKLVKHLSLTNVCVSQQTTNYIKKMLDKIEILHLRHCSMHRNLYDVLLKYCTNIRKIYIQKNDNNKFHGQFKWLLRQYTTLEYLELSLQRSIKIDEFRKFFKRNPNVRNFTCDSFVLWPNASLLLNSTAKLDTFGLKYVGIPLIGNNSTTVKPLCNLLNRLHSQGFYERLHVNVFLSRELDFINGVEKIFIPRSNMVNSIDMLLSDLVEFTVAEVNERFDRKMIENLVNLERLYLEDGSADDILPFIQLTKKLNKIKLIPRVRKNWIHFEYEPMILKLYPLNAEREKLAGARKVTIYVPDTVFLATKWWSKNGVTNFSLIEMKRIGSYDWHLLR
ncbi:uncharacterized protein LOC116349772 [Contarinia nasturtii]|uniref:uncharacterized protein LOC116349772 n=1 Tax=Contarinia nasturtii TaxID=265458 RepID=UPI0012D378C5|nr:uncharacterized protein LOC116349772 [Contarinia nasturtii]XP_031637230.1 uncharacterized protein LOC116349772 [Contarinia nasturtii]